MADKQIKSEINSGVVDDFKYTVAGGSTRSEKAPPYHLNPGHGYRRTTLRFGLGAEKHGEGNWMKSIMASEADAYAFCREAYNHMIEHMRRMTSGNYNPDVEDDLGAIGWGVEVLAFTENFWSKPWTKLDSGVERDPLYS